MKMFLNQCLASGVIEQSRSKDKRCAKFQMTKQHKNKKNRIPVNTGTKMIQKEEKSIVRIGKKPVLVNLAMIENQ